MLEVHHTPTCTNSGLDLQLAVVFPFHQLIQTFHLHSWWSSPATTVPLEGLRGGILFQQVSELVRVVTHVLSSSPANLHNLMPNVTHLCMYPNSQAIVHIVHLHAYSYLYSCTYLPVSHPPASFLLLLLVPLSFQSGCMTEGLPR